MWKKTLETHDFIFFKYSLFKKIVIHLAYSNNQHLTLNLRNKEHEKIH
jgi:hypothetical protein